MRRRRWAGLLCVVLFGLGLVSCESDSDDAAPADTNVDTTTPTPTTVADPRTGDQLSADRTAATSALILLADLPSEWTAVPRDDAGADDEGPEIDTQMAECLNVDKDLFAESPVEVKSDTFTLADAEVESEVSMLATTADAQTVVDILARPETSGCLQEAVRTVLTYSVEHPDPGEELPAGVTFGDVNLADLPFVDLGDYSRAFRITVGVNAADLTAELYMDVLFIQVDRAIGTLTFLNVVTPFDEALATDLAATFASRLPAA